MKSFSVHQTEGEKIINKKLSSCRRVVENAFGHLKARFRKVGKGLEVNIKNVNTIIKACCIMHNICNNRNDNINQCWIQQQPQRSISVSDTNNSGICRKQCVVFF
uniref:DDE Tnp4 domain-containing protein n=1 Tax=Bactrocera dorsalis TaxID=27457 RepID=A0A034WP76_BACDO